MSAARWLSFCLATLLILMFAGGATADDCSTFCCEGQTGDVNGFGGDVPTIGDVSVLIDFLFISKDPSSIPCIYEADVNQSGGCDPTLDDITIADVGDIISLLYLPIFPPVGPRPCLCCPIAP